MAMTGMMTHYLNTKQENPDAILFYRLGDFYEMFFEDAILVSRELELTLTGKDCGLEERAPMCGVPYHAVDLYVGKLIEKGYKVAICEQMEDPAQAKGLVRREVTRVITPGTLIETDLLDDRASNYILAVCFRQRRAGLAFCDVSTGEFSLYEVPDPEIRLSDEIMRISPSEILVNDPERFRGIVSGFRAQGIEGEDWSLKPAQQALRAQFPEDLASDEIAELKTGITAAGVLLIYLTRTQKVSLKHLIRLQRYDTAGHLRLDRTAMRNLELTETIRGERNGSLLHTIDRTSTAMGSRLLRAWLTQPLSDRSGIEQRLDAVEELKGAPIATRSLKESLSGIYDIERLLSRIAYRSVGPRDCLSLLASLDMLPILKEKGSSFGAGLLRDLFGDLDALDDLRSELRRAISPDAPMSAKDPGIFRQGYHAELDELRDVSVNAKQYISRLEAQERDRTGIRNLKIGYNRVFGYYLEVTRINLSQVPGDYIRKQTLANGERYITEELKELEQKILGADEKALRLESGLFASIRDRLIEVLPPLRRNANALKRLDVLISLSEIATERSYVRPLINEEGRYEIRDGRHPVVEKAIGQENFVPNDTDLTERERIMILTGPNMAGKSTYMRQVALIVLLAHIGSFVPASYADISLTDRIFTRIGASDDLYAGQSTFMVEMNEMATILRYATSKSLLILDEVGRGTSTFDGLSIAWASVEYLASEHCGARTLFATHYHELSELEGKLEGVRNYRITAKEQGEDVIFLRKIVPGGEDHSFGVAVAKLAGLPKNVISRARQILTRLEVDDQQKGSIGQSILDGRKNAGDRQISFTEFAPMELVQEISQLDVVSMTPIEALNKLFELNEKARRI